MAKDRPTPYITEKYLLALLLWKLLFSLCCRRGQTQPFHVVEDSILGTVYYIHYTILPFLLPLETFPFLSRQFHWELSSRKKPWCTIPLLCAVWHHQMHDLRLTVCMSHNTHLFLLPVKCLPQRGQQSDINNSPVTMV